MHAARSITDIDKFLGSLRQRPRAAAFDFLYDLVVAERSLIIPESFKPKVFDYFAARDASGETAESLAEVTRRLSAQKIIRIINKWTNEATQFNSLRASRPGVTRAEAGAEREQAHRFIEGARRHCDFCQPELYTPEDSFGRIRGDFCLSWDNLLAIGMSARITSWPMIIPAISGQRAEPSTANPLQSMLGKWID